MQELLDKPGAIEDLILEIRGQKVMIDADLARLFQTKTKRLNEQVKRNIARFPYDFMFQLTQEEKSEVVAKCDHLEKIKYSKTLPYVFTEHGCLMAASVLNSNIAIKTSVEIIRTFVKMRSLLSKSQKLNQKFEEIEKHLTLHDKHILEIFKTIKQLMQMDETKTNKKVGFQL